MLDRVDEEVASLSGSGSFDPKRASVADSVQTVLFRPLEDAQDGDADHADLPIQGSARHPGSDGSSQSSYRASASRNSGRNSSSQGSYGTPLTEDGHKLETSRSTGQPQGNTAPTSVSWPKISDTADAEPEDWNLVSDDTDPSQLAERVTRSPVGGTMTYRPGRNAQPYISAPHTSRKKGLATRLANGYDRGHTRPIPEEKHEAAQPAPRVMGIEGMIDSIGSSQQQAKPKVQHFSRPFSQASSYSGSDRSAAPTPIHRNKRPAQEQYHETIRDGVPILMHQRSGVWVEAVDGVDLTSTQKGQDTDAADNIPELEAEDVKHIQLQDPETVVTTFPQMRSSADGQSKDSGYSSGSAPNATATFTPGRGNTERWARDQAALRRLSTLSTGTCERCDSPMSEHTFQPGKGKGSSLPVHVCPYLYPTNTTAGAKNLDAGVSSAWAPSAHVNQGGLKQSVDSPIKHVTRSITADRDHNDRLPTAQIRQVVQQPRNETDKHPAEIQAKINTAAAGIEDVIYATGPAQMRNRRAEMLRELG